MSFTKWAVRLGIVTMEEAVGLNFRGSERGVPNKHCNFKKQEAWEELAGEDAGRFNANKSAATLIKDPVLRLLQIYLGYNLLGQECCFTKVTLTKLCFIWKAYMHEPVNLAFWTAYQVHQTSKNRIRHLSLCHILGAFLARNMQIRAPSSLGRWEVVPSPTLFDTDFLISKQMARMKKGKVEVICSSSRDHTQELQVLKEEGGTEMLKKKKRMVAIQRRSKPAYKSNEEDQPVEEAKSVQEKADKKVKKLKKEQRAQRGVINQMQLMIQDLVKVLKESHIQPPAPSQQLMVKPEESSNDPMETEATQEAEEKEQEVPQTSDEKETKEEEDNQEDIQDEEPEQAAADQKAERMKQKKERRAALKLKMKEKLRAMMKKARSRAMKKRATSAAAKEARNEDEAEASSLVQNEPIKSRKRKSKGTSAKDKSLRSKRRR